VRVQHAAPMLRPRTGFDSVVLGDGTVLAVGDDVACLPGPAEPGSETAERYDPAADRWTEAASLNKPRKSFATVVMPDGRALVTGGTNPDDQLYSSTKLFDPSTGAWTDGPLLDIARADPAAVTLADGRVMVGSLVARGETGDTTTTEMLDAGAETWSSGPPINGFGVLGFIPLTDGRVLATGFEVDVALELFDAAAGTWTPIDGPRVVRQPRFVPIDGGDFLAFGFEEVGEGQQLTNRVERFDSESVTWAEVAPMSTAREGAMITTLPDGRVFVAGGAVYEADGTGVEAVATTEIYDPAADAWSAGPDLLESRKDGSALVLPDGSVLIHGGDASFNTQGDVPFCPDPMVSTERVYLGT
jgi:large repetitive protein